MYQRNKTESVIQKNPESNRLIRDQIGGALITDLSEVVNQESKEHSVSQDLINAVIRHESGAFERRIFGNGLGANMAEAVEAIARSPFGSQASIGIGQMQLQQAIMLENLGYVPQSDTTYDLIAKLLDPATAVEYIAGCLEYLTDQLTSTYGDQFTSLDLETRYRLILIGYNYGWINLKRYIDRYGFERLIDDSKYDNYTLDDYYQWKSGR
jgi:hypothetical protein